MFNFICFILPIFLFCVPHVTLSYFNFCVVPIIAFTFDKDIFLNGRAAFIIHISTKSLEICCNIKKCVGVLVYSLFHFFSGIRKRRRKLIRWETSCPLPRSSNISTLPPLSPKHTPLLLNISLTSEPENRLRLPTSTLCSNFRF